jgi:hypothetical protein
MINIIFKNNTIIKILAIEHLNVNFYSFLMIRSLVKHWWYALTIRASYSVCHVLKKIEKLWARLFSVVSTEFWYGVEDTTFDRPEHSNPDSSFRTIQYRTRYTEQPVLSVQMVVLPPLKQKFY